MDVMMTLRQKGRNRVDLLILLVPLLFLSVFFFYPLANIIGDGLTATAVGELLGRGYFARTVWFTVWQATLSTLLTLIVGLPVAYLFAHYDFPAKRLLRALTTVPFVMPTVVVAASFQALFGSRGPINVGLMWLTGSDEPILRLNQTLLIILLAHVFYNMTIVIRLVGGFWSTMNPRLNEGAAMLGATPVRTFFEITLPLLRPPIIGASLLIFLFTFTSYGVILILGGPSFSTVETEIYRQYTTYLRADVAAILSLLQILFTFLLMSFYARWQAKSGVALDFRPARQRGNRPVTPIQQRLLLLLITLVTIIMLSPLLALVWRSLLSADGQFTLSYYQALPSSRAGRTAFIAPWQAVGNSIGYALLTMLVAGTLGLMTAVALLRAGRWRRWLDAIFMLPLGASAVTLGFGYVISFPNLRTSPLLVLIAHVLVALPFVVRSLLPVLQAIKPSMREAAALHGADQWRVWREIDLPIVGRALLVGLIFAFTISMGEFGATSFIARPNSGFLTVPIAIERFLGQPGTLNFGQALALSTILMAVCAIGFVAIERFRLVDSGEF